MRIAQILRCAQNDRCFFMHLLRETGAMVYPNHALKPIDRGRKQTFT